MVCVCVCAKKDLIGYMVAHFFPLAFPNGQLMITFRSVASVVIKYLPLSIHVPVCPLHAVLFSPFHAPLPLPLLNSLPPLLPSSSEIQT